MDTPESRGRVEGRSAVNLPPDGPGLGVDDVEALIDLGNQLMREGQHRRALRNFQQAYALLARLATIRARQPEHAEMQGGHGGRHSLLK
jgi:hypothetical protein